MADASIAVVTGPTAAGKSAIALWLAERQAGTIVSADSRQVYRRFDVGTAKPEVAERERVPHDGVDVVEPTVRYSAFAWATGAESWLDAARSAGRVPIVTGGTGLYLRALFGDTFAEPAFDGERRVALERWLATLDLSELRRWCAALDPSRAGLGRTQLLRSIEVALLTGERLSALHVATRRPPRFRARYLVVDPGPALGARIADRARRMMDVGWPEEVERLIATVADDAPAWKSSGYRAVRDLVEGRATREATVDRVIIETRQFAKRQRTWFRHQLEGEDVTMVDPLDPGWQQVVSCWWTAGAGSATP